MVNSPPQFNPNWSINSPEYSDYLQKLNNYNTQISQNTTPLGYTRLPAYNDEAQKQASINEITKNYNDLALATMNRYNDRNMLGSSAFGEDMNKQVNYGLGQSLASYQGQAEANKNQYNVQGASLAQSAMNNLVNQQQQAQANQLKNMQFQQQLNYQKQRDIIQDRQQQDLLRYNQNKQKYPNNPSWW